MIALFTDFGLKNPYVGQMHAAIIAAAPSARIINLFHHAPAYDTKRSAYLLKSLSQTLPEGTIIIGVVDPGVGSKQKAIAVKSNNLWFVGPDNGLFSLLIETGDDSSVYDVIYQPEQLSNTFHGRDLFAPVAAEIAKGNLDAVLSPKQSHHSLTRDFALLWPQSLPEIIYIDDYGNATTGLHIDRVKHSKKLSVNYSILPYRRTFSRAQIGQPFWTINSMGLVEIAANQTNASKLLSLSIGDSVELI